MKYLHWVENALDEGVGGKRGREGGKAAKGLQQTGCKMARRVCTVKVSVPKKKRRSGATDGAGGAGCFKASLWGAAC